MSTTKAAELTVLVHPTNIDLSLSTASMSACVVVIALIAVVMVVGIYLIRDDKKELRKFLESILNKLGLAFVITLVLAFFVDAGSVLINKLNCSTPTQKRLYTTLDVNGRLLPKTK